MRKWWYSLMTALFVATVTFIGCASDGARRNGESNEVPAPGNLLDVQTHIRPDGSISPTPVTPPDTGRGEDMAGAPAPTVAEVLGNQPTARVDENILRELRGSVEFLELFRAPDARTPRGALGSNVSRTVLYFRKGDRNPFGVIARDEKTGQLYWPEMFAINAVSTDHELNATSMRIVYAVDNTYSDAWDIPLQVKRLRTNLQNLVVGDGVQLFGAGKWLLAPVPQRLSDEMRGIVRGPDGQPIKDENGNPLRRYRFPVWHLHPENIYVTPDMFSSHSEAVGGTVRGSDLELAIEPRPDGCLIGMEHLPDNESEGPERVVEITP